MKILNTPLQNDQNAIKDSQNRVIAYTEFTPRAGMTEARAVAIVNAVNSVSEMRYTLRECHNALTQLGDVYGMGDNMVKLLARIETLTAPTREEAEQGAE